MTLKKTSADHDLHSLEKILNIKPLSPEGKTLLKEAITPPGGKKTPLQKDYERLEFLGDRVLGICMARILFDRYPKETAGNLSLRYNALVSTEMLAKISKTMGLLNYTTLQTPQISQKITADILEALIGAVYIAQGLKEAMSLITKFWSPFLTENSQIFRDIKTTLQELLQTHGYPPPLYKVIKTEGQQHAPIFTVSVQAMNQVTKGQGKTKQKAEQQAARKILQILKKLP